MPAISYCLNKLDMKKILGILILVSGMLTSCISYTEVQLKNVAFRDFSTSDNKMRATFDLEIDNPNGYPIRLSKPKFKVFVGDLELKDWSVPKKIKLRRRAVETYPFYVEISAIEGLKILPRLLTGPEIRIEGTVKAGTFIFGRRIPLGIKEKLY